LKGLPESMFTVGVFKDVEWARRGLQALTAHGFAPPALSIVGKQNPETAALVEQIGGRSADPLLIARVGPVLAAGPLLGTLNGLTSDLASLGIAGTMRRAGFQAHDGQIFEMLLLQGGVLVAVLDEARAADALSVLHAYGGGNAAIGAWAGRV
jgi:hypothetical protein